MKYQILELGVYKRYVIICSVDDPKEFYDTFDIVDSDAIEVFEETWETSKAFMLSGFIKAKNNAFPKDAYEHRCYFIIHINSKKDTKYITHGILAHEILHVVQSIIDALDNEVGDEAEAYLIGTITDFVYEFFNDHKIRVHLVDKIRVSLPDKHKEFIKYPAIY